MDHRRFEDLRLSKHAQERCQQRGISPKVLETLYTYGKRTWSRGGAWSYSINRNRLDKVRIALGELEFRRIREKLDCYMIVAPDAGTIVTVGHRTHRRSAA